MSKMNPNEKKENASKNENVNNEEATNLQEEQSNAADETAGSDNVSGEVEALQKKYNELNDSHLRLMAEFDNYRFERALQNVRTAEDVEAVKEGVDLIFGKFMGYLSQQGVKPIEAIGKPFNTEEFEAIATIPAPEPDMKGKVLDCVQTGYTLFDKVIRHAKVVVGE